MATVIDALIITLGFDTKGLKQGQAESNKAIDDTKKKTKELTDQEKKHDTEVKKRHEENKKRTKETSDGFKTLSKDALAFFGVVASATGMARFIGDLTNSNAKLERTATNLDSTTESLSAWGGAVEQMGGNAQEAISTMQMLSQSMTQILLTGDSPNLPFLRQLGVDMNIARKAADPLAAIILQMAEGAKRNEAIAGRSTAFNMLRMAGVDEGMANLMFKSNRDISVMLQHQKDLGVVQTDNARRSQELARQWVELSQKGRALGLSIESFTTPALTGLLKNMMDFADQNPNIIKGLGAIAGVFVAMLMPSKALYATLAAVSTILLADDWQTYLNGGDSAIGKLINKTKELHKWLSLGNDTSREGVSKTSGDIESRRGVRKVTAKDYADKAKKEKRLEEMSESDIISHMMSKGWSRENAISIAANLKAESSLNPNAQNKNSSAFGYAQWLNSRQNVFKRNFGKSLKSASPREQLDFIDWELKNTHKNVGDQLKGMGVGEGAALLSNKYEVPSTSQFGLDAAAMTRARMAEKMAGVQPSYNNNASTSTSTNSTTIGQVNVYTQATDGAGAAVSFSRAIANQSESGAF